MNHAHGPRSPHALRRALIAICAMLAVGAMLSIWLAPSVWIMIVLLGLSYLIVSISEEL